LPGKQEFDLFFALVNQVVNKTVTSP